MSEPLQGTISTRRDAGGTASGNAEAYHFVTGELMRVCWHDGQITSFAPVAGAPPCAERGPGGTPGALWLAPSLVDLQINGYAGVDFQRDDVTTEELLHATRALRRDGCAHFLLTLITDEWPRLLARLRQFKKLRDESAELRDAIIGWHMEGPFLSEKPGFHGAHRPALMCDPTPRHMEELRAVTGDDRVLLTMAPERHGALEAITLATSLGLRVSLGHTDASAEILSQAVAAGATGFTHLGNGCPRDLDRHDNILWRVCETSGLTVSFIPDGHHVSPAPFRLLHRLLAQRAAGLQPAGESLHGKASPELARAPVAIPPLPVANWQDVYYTTDAMSAAGAGPGRYSLGAVEVEVGAEQIVRQPGQSNFAGSALTPIQGVFRAAQMLNCPWQECWRRFSDVPARFMEFENELRVGAKSFCLVEPESGLDTVRLLE